MIEIMLRNNCANGPSTSAGGNLSIETIGTIISNFAYYGYVPSSDLLATLMKSDDVLIGDWWSSLDKALAAITGDDKNIADFVVYKNFPTEVLSMSQAEYWAKQILMYIGYPSDFFTEEELAREVARDMTALKVIHLANEDTINELYDNLLRQPARWNESQMNQVCFLTLNARLPLDISIIPFKENMAYIASKVMDSGTVPSLNSATDVLRLVAAISDQDISLKTNIKFRSFSRRERRSLLDMINMNIANLEEDLSRRPETWKRFLHNLHPMDYKDKYPEIIRLHDDLYKGVRIKTHASLMEEYLLNKDKRALILAKGRPGDFVRRLRKMIDVFGDSAALTFAEVTPKLSVIQMLKVRNYITNVNDRKYRIFPPKGNWSKVKIEENLTKIKDSSREIVLAAVNSELGIRVNAKLPGGVTLDSSAEFVKLKDSDSTLTDYGRGTVFPIPDGINFLRLASYWEVASSIKSNVWFDNGVNFYSEGWNPMGTVCWNRTAPLFNKGAVFSGDPTSANTDGKAAQLIDVYLDKLVSAGVRYVVWNILAYSNIKFSDAICVRALLQWGKDPVKGNLFDPARCQMQFPINSNNLTSYIAYIDVLERKIVYMDAPFKGNVSSAATNESKLSVTMPAYLEYLRDIPSVADLFANVNPGDSALISYSDAEYNLSGQSAYIFRPENETNIFKPLNLNDLMQSPCDV